MENKSIPNKSCAAFSKFFFTIFCQEKLVYFLISMGDLQRFNDEFFLTLFAKKNIPQLLTISLGCHGLPILNFMPIQCSDNG